MFKVAVCDDDVILCEKLEKELELLQTEEKLEIEIFYSAEKLIERMKSQERFDLIYLDIEFEDIDGVTAGKVIRNQLGDERVQIVYISARQDYAMELFESRPMNFLVKPISVQKIKETLRKAKKLLGEEKNYYFEYKTRLEMFRIPYSEIYFFESSNRKVLIHSKQERKEIYMKLSDIEKNLPMNFVRVHQSYLINTIYVKRWKADEIIMTDGSILAISSPYKKCVKEYIIQNE